MVADPIYQLHMIIILKNLIHSTFTTKNLNIHQPGPKKGVSKCVQTFGHPICHILVDGLQPIF